MSTLASSVAIATPAPVVHPTPKRWTRQEYHRLGEQGWFQNQRVELIDGEIIILSPQSPQHANSTERIRRLLERVFDHGYCVRPHLPVVLGEFSEPEPDISVVRGAIDDYVAEHPRSAVLGVEVSRTSLQYDRDVKPHVYASMGVPEYWLLDLVNRQLVVHRQPAVDASVRLGHAYKSITIVAEGGIVAPLEKSQASLLVAEMLPPTV